MCLFILATRVLKLVVDRCTNRDCQAEEQPQNEEEQSVLPPKNE